MDLLNRILDWWRLHRAVKRLDQMIMNAEEEEVRNRKLAAKGKYTLLSKFVEKTDPLPQMRLLREITAEASRKLRPWG